MDAGRHRRGRLNGPTFEVEWADPRPATTSSYHPNLGSGGGYAVSVPDEDRELALELLAGEPDPAS